MTPEQEAMLARIGALLPMLEALVAAPAPAPAPVAPPAAPTNDTTPADPAPAPVAEPKQDMEPPAPKQPEEQRNDNKDEIKMTPEMQERIVNDSIELRDQARKVLGDEYEFRGKSNRQVMIDVVKHVDSNWELGDRSEDYLRGEFSGALRQDAKDKAAAKETEDLGSHLELRSLEFRKDSKGESSDDSYEDTLNKNLTNASRRRSA